MEKNNINRLCILLLFLGVGWASSNAVSDMNGLVNKFILEHPEFALDKEALVKKLAIRRSEKEKWQELLDEALPNKIVKQAIRGEVLVSRNISNSVSENSLNKVSEAMAVNSLQKISELNVQQSSSPNTTQPLIPVNQIDPCSKVIEDINEALRRAHVLQACFYFRNKILSFGCPALEAQVEYARAVQPYQNQAELSPGKLLKQITITIRKLHSLAKEAQDFSDASGVARKAGRVAARMTRRMNALSKLGHARSIRTKRTKRTHSKIGF